MKCRKFSPIFTTETLMSNELFDRSSQEFNCTLIKETLENN